MTEWVYDNSWEGFLTAVFEAFARRKEGASVLPARLADGISLFSRETVVNDAQKAARVERGMKRLHPETPGRVYTVWLSERAGIENVLIGFLQAGFDENIDPMINMLHPSVYETRRVLRLVGHESHRMLQFVRFIRTPEGVYAADIRPEFNVLPLIGEHFHGRFNDQRVLIRDVGRKTALVSQPGEWFVQTLGDLPLPPLPEDGEFEALWRGYFKTIANPSRINLRLQRQFVPHKYREFLTEFREV